MSRGPFDTTEPLTVLRQSPGHHIFGEVLRIEKILCGAVIMLGIVYRVR